MARKSQLWFPNEFTNVKEIHHPETEIDQIVGLGLQRSKAYILGDIAYSGKLPSYLHLECTTAGTTAETEPTITGKVEGNTITDGTAVWTVKKFGGGSSGGVQLADVTGVGYDKATGRVSITWTDPDDVTYQGASLARWAGTKLVRKVGSSPASVSDGTVVVDSKVKNQYSTTAFVDTGLTDGTVYYYRLFPYTDAGTYTAGTAFGATPNKLTTTMTVNKTVDAYGIANSLVEVATVTTNGDGPITATSSDTSIGTVSVSNNKIYAVPVSNGTITITINQLAGIEYGSAGPDTISVTVVLLSPALRNNTPAQIQYAAQHDLASSLWDIGDYFEMTLNGNWTCVNHTITLSNYVVRCVLIGINHNASKEGNHLLHFQMGKNTDNVDIAFDCSETHDGDGSNGWETCHMRKITMANLYSTIIPANWRNVIATTTKYTKFNSNVSATEDKCFLLAEYEVFGEIMNEYIKEEQNYQQQYEYYANGNSKVRYSHKKTYNKINWWFRSGDSRGFYNIGYPSDGSIISGYNYNHFDFGVSPCFSIG